MIETLKCTTLLYIEDDDIIREQYMYVFKDFFAQVIEAKSALEGLEYFETMPVHCIISDIVMNDMSGIELIVAIRKKDNTIPIILFSSHPTQEFLLESITLNLSSFLVKPASLSQIKKALERCANKMLQEYLLGIELFDGIEYSPILKVLTTPSDAHHLSKKEALVLELLIRNRNKIVSKEMIEENVYCNQEMSNSALSNLLFKLRRKLPLDAISTMSGQGVMLT